MESSVNVAIVALAGTFLTTMITQICQYAISKQKLRSEKEARIQEYYSKHRAEVIEKYINGVGKMCAHTDGLFLEDVSPYIGEIYLYVDKSNWQLLDLMRSDMYAHNFTRLEDELLELCKRLSTQGVRHNN